MINILIAGDVAPSMEDSQFIIGRGDCIFGELKTFIDGSDISIVNLEAPVIVNKPTPIKKSGPNLFTTNNTIDVLHQIGFNVLTLANNHFFDQGQNGVETTISACRQNNIEFVGGGENKGEARRILYKYVSGKCIAIINACENEYSIATDEHGGSNSLDLIQMQEDIFCARNNADFVILIIHGGVEYYQYPTPRMKRWYRHFVDLGADAIINHHQHCMCGYEVYKEKPIFYGLGNFYFPILKGMRKPDCWDYGYAVQLSIDTTIKFKMIPYKQDINAITLRDYNDFENEIMSLSLPISDGIQLQQIYDNYITDQEYDIKQALLPPILHTRFLKALVRRGYLGGIYGLKENLLLKNVLTCESHHEKMQRLFMKLIEKEK